MLSTMPDFYWVSMMWLFVVVWTFLGYFCVRVGGKAPLGTTCVYTLVAFVSAIVVSGA